MNKVRHIVQKVRDFQFPTDTVHHLIAFIQSLEVKREVSRPINYHPFRHFTENKIAPRQLFCMLIHFYSTQG